MHARWSWRSLVVGAAIVLAPVVAVGADLEAGKALYGKWCQSCHGADGKGNPVMAQALKTKALNLGAVDLSTLSASEREAREQGFRTMIAEGKPPMAGFAKRLSAAEQENALAYIEATFMKGGQ